MSNQVLDDAQAESQAAEASTNRQQLIHKANVEGNPWAQVIGMFPDDEITKIWIEEMKAARLRAEGGSDQG